MDGPPIVNPRYDLSGNTVLMVLPRSRNGMGAQGMVLGCSKDVAGLGAWSSDAKEMVWVLGGCSCDVQRNGMTPSAMVF